MGKRISSESAAARSQKQQNEASRHPLGTSVEPRRPSGRIALGVNGNHSFESLQER
jgi:hypothetical protein